MNTKDQIVQTALKLFLSRGFKGTSMNDIAKQVGITKPAIYHYFDNKDKLIEAIFDHFSQRMAKWSAENISQCNSNKEKIHKLFSSIATFMNVEKVLLDEEIGDLPFSYDMFILLMSRMSDAYKNRISQDFLETQKRFTDIFSAMQSAHEIRDDIDAATLSLMMHSILEGLSFLGEITDRTKVVENSEKIYHAFWKLLHKAT